VREHHDDGTQKGENLLTERGKLVGNSTLRNHQSEAAVCERATKNYLITQKLITTRGRGNPITSITAFQSEESPVAEEGRGARPQLEGGVKLDPPGKNAGADLAAKVREKNRKFEKTTQHSARERTRPGKNLGICHETSQKKKKTMEEGESLQ